MSDRVEMEIVLRRLNIWIQRAKVLGVTVVYTDDPDDGYLGTVGIVEMGAISDDGETLRLTSEDSSVAPNAIVLMA